MWDWLRARKEGRASSGNGRRQSYQHLPDGAHDQHLPAGRPRRPRRDRAPAPTTACTSPSCGGGQVNTATGDFVFGMTEAYLIENGEITEPLREGNLIGNGPEVLTRIDAARHRLRHGPARAPAARTARASPSATASPTLRVTSLTIGGTAGVNLLEVGDLVVGMAEPGEQVEAVRGPRARHRDQGLRRRDRVVRLRPSPQGVGIRVIADGRQGFAYAATFDADVLAETMADARDNAAFGTPDPDLGLAEPDGVAVADLDLYDESLESFPTDRKIEIAVELERATLAADPRVRASRRAEYVDARRTGPR